MADRIYDALSRALTASAEEMKANPRMKIRQRRYRHNRVRAWARETVIMYGGRWSDYANPFEYQLSEVWRV